MGLFGMDYNKPGRGVDKNAPKKKSFVVFFEIYFRKFWKLITVNLLYVLVSLPVVTAGLAHAGLTYITRNFAREKHAFTSDFFDIIRRNWKQALPVGIINTIVGGCIAYAIWFYYTVSVDLVGQIFLALILVIALIYLFMRYYIYMLMVTFKFSLKQLYKNSLIMAVSCWKPNLIITAGLVVCYGLVAGLMLLMASVDVRVPVALLLFLYIFFIPAFRALLIQHCIFPSVKKLIIDPYYEANPDADKSQLRALNIISEEEQSEEKDEDEVVFTDRGSQEKPAAKEESGKKSNWKFPKQYSEAERRAARSGRFAAADDDDDDTI